MSLVVNSFTETTEKMLQNVNIALESMVQMNNSLTTQDDTVTIEVEGVDPVTGDTSIYNYTIPSYSYTLDQLNRISNSMDTFISGNGVVLLNDGTYRAVSTVPLSVAPAPILGVNAPTQFQSRVNWFFESLLFPQTYVEFDLKGKIDDRSDRIIMRRVIFDNFDDVETQWFTDNFIGQTYTYQDAITKLNDNNKKYWLDQENVNLPILTNEYTGNFVILNKNIIDNQEWYYLDTLNYALVTDEAPVKNIELKIGDQLRYNENSLFKVDEIQVTEKRVRLTPILGLGLVTVGRSFSIYSTPFENKYVRIPVGYNECNILFMKGINDDFNVAGDSWGESINFYTNDLTYGNTPTGYENYYLQNVIDFGKQMEGEAKERFVPAYFGVTPDAPTLTVEQFGVNQINTQINASLDTEAIKTTQTQIENTKSVINSLKNTIAQQKAELVELTDVAERADLQAKIDNNTSQLSKQTVEYSSLVRSLSTVAYENDAVVNNPMYRIRGFFDVPAPKRLTTDQSEKPQEIIQFEVAHRYLRLDGTGNPLNSYTYTDPSTGQPVTGTFTDWIITPSIIKEKVYDASKGSYVWVTPSVQDGQAVNINQIDIPITKGEKVQVRVRSISEAGWPTNPKKSSWSDAVVIEFPSNLQGSDQVLNILEDAQDEETSIKLDETLNAAGVYTHLNDSVPNPNSGDGTYFKHQAQFLAYDLAIKNITNVTSSVSTVDLQTTLANLPTNSYVTLSKPPGATSGYPQLTGTLQQLLQAMVNATPAIFDEFESEITSV